jgi:putative transposase
MPEIVKTDVRNARQTHGLRKTDLVIQHPPASDTWARKHELALPPSTERQKQGAQGVIHRDKPATLLRLPFEDVNLPAKQINLRPPQREDFTFSHASVKGHDADGTKPWVANLVASRQQLRLLAFFQHAILSPRNVKELHVLELMAELQRRGWAVNHKRVYRLMREDNLLCLRKRKFVLTTDSHHGLPTYPNRVCAMKLTGLDQLWVADITYIRLELEFVYLAVMLDAFPRRVIGWALDRTLEAALTLQALRMALALRRPSPGLGHHSDRGVQYASHDYTRLLQDHGIQISMSRKANPWDHAACESFVKTLKYEEVYRTEYRDLAEARAGIGVFPEKVYNQNRLHSALGYLPPVEFERGLLVQTDREAAWRQLFS